LKKGDNLGGGATATTKLTWHDGRAQQIVLGEDANHCGGEQEKKKTKGPGSKLAFSYSKKSTQKPKKKEIKAKVKDDRSEPPSQYDTALTTAGTCKVKNRSKD